MPPPDQRWRFRLQGLVRANSASTRQHRAPSVTDACRLSANLAATPARTSRPQWRYGIYCLTRASYGVIGSRRGRGRHSPCRWLCPCWCAKEPDLRRTQWRAHDRKACQQTQSYLANRLAENPRLEAASTCQSLGEATSITQQIIDANREQIGAWIANTIAGDRLIISVSRPITSSQYVPIGTVLRRDLPSPAPGNGARAVLERSATAPGGFTVITSYPILSGWPSQDQEI